MIKKMNRFTACLSLSLASAVTAMAEPAPFEKEEFLDNGKVRLGLDMTAGGSIFHFGTSGGANLLNHFDKGRFIQQSYYGKEDGSDWNGKPWRWNPVQGGGYRGEAAGVLEFERRGQTIRVVSIPRHWATGKPVDDTRMTSVITLDGMVANISFRFQYTGDVAHPSHHQELPAVFVDAAYPNLIRYEGKLPWTGAALTRSIPGWPNQAATADENWAAWVNDKDWGIGVSFPGSTQLTTYRYEGDGKQGPLGSACSYFAPVREFAITPGTDFKYQIHLTVGTADEIRTRFQALHLPEKAGKP